MAFLEVTFPKLKARSPGRCPSSSHLSVEGDGAGLALGADPLGPGRVSLTPRLDLTADVLQGYKLPPGRGGEEKGGRERGRWEKKRKKDEKREKRRKREEKAAVTTVNAFGAILSGACGK